MSRGNGEAVRLKVRCSPTSDRRPGDVWLAVRLPAVARVIARQALRLPHGRMRRATVRWATCRIRDTFNRRELDTLPVLVHPNAESHFGGDARLVFDLDPIYHGPDGLRRALEAWLEGWETFRAEINEVVDMGDRLVFLFDFLGIGGRSGAPVRERMGQVYAFHNGWVSQVQVFWNWSEALEAVGLRE